MAKPLPTLMPLLLLVGGCVENALGPLPEPAGEPGPTDTDPADSDVPDTDLPDPDRDACESEDWPERTVSVPETCPPVSDWSLVEAWRHEVGYRVTMGLSPFVGRYEDRNDDGLVDIHDPMGIWVVPNSMWEDWSDEIHMVDVAGAHSLAEDALNEAYRSYGALADLDPTNDGLELFLVWAIFRGDDRFALLDEIGLLDSIDLGLELDGGSGVPFLADLEGDGLIEVLVGRHVFDPATGEVLADLGSQHWGDPVAADLDLDGTSEILGANDGVESIQAVIHNADGTVRTSCGTFPRGAEGMVAFAVGDLDGDPKGEFVAAGPGAVVVCDTDGTPLAQLEVESTYSLLGLAELDGDPLPEIVLGENVADALESRIIALHHDLTEIWRWDGFRPGWLPFTAADLDGDGLHEILVHQYASLTILGPDGVRLAAIDAPQSHNGWINVPAVADVDNDGLAEIVIVGSEPAAAVFENASGGWPLEAQDPWPGVNHFPGDRLPDGKVAPPLPAHWQAPGGNVWSGLAPGVPDDLPDLGVAIEAACADDCASVLFTAYVWNSGAGPTWRDVGVELRRLSDGAVIGVATVPSGLPPGRSVPVQIAVAPGEAAGGVEVVVDGTQALGECGDAPNYAVWSDIPCL